MPRRRAGAEPLEWLHHLPPLPQLGPAAAMGRIALPFAIYAVLMLFVHLLWPERFALTLARTLSVFLVGKFAAAAAHEDFLYWVFMIGTVDVLVGLFLVWNFDLLYRIPGMGPMLHAMESRSASFLDERPWVRKLAFVGIVLVVIVPFHGTGAVMGSIVGRLTGLGRWRVLAAIALGGYTGVALMLSASWLVALLSGVSPIAGIGMVVVLVAAGLAVWARWFRRRRALEAPTEGAAPPEGP
jgi:uncharacterized membrane protein